MEEDVILPPLLQNQTLILPAHRPVPLRPVLRECLHSARERGVILIHCKTNKMVAHGRILLYATKTLTSHVLKALHPTPPNSHPALLEVGNMQLVLLGPPPPSPPPCHLWLRSPQVHKSKKEAILKSTRNSTVKLSLEGAIESGASAHPFRSEKSR